MIALLVPALALAEPAHAGPLEPGPYVLEVAVATEAKLPFFGRAQVTTTTRAAARVEERDGQLLLWQEPCTVEVEGGGPGRTEIPDAFVSAFPAQRYPIELEADGARWRFRADPGPICVGCEGGLPSVAEGALDWEGDGRPGATVQLRVPIFGRVDVYVAQYSHVVYEGRLEGGGAVGGVRFVTMDQTTLGASHPGFGQSPPIEPVPERSSFRLLPADGPVRCGARTAAVEPPGTTVAAGAALRAQDEDQNPTR